MSLASFPVLRKCRHLLWHQVLVPWKGASVGGPWFCAHVWVLWPCWPGSESRTTDPVSSLLLRKAFCSTDMEIPYMQCQQLLAGGVVSLDTAAPVPPSLGCHRVWLAKYVCVMATQECPQGSALDVECKPVSHLSYLLGKSM